MVCRLDRGEGGTPELAKGSTMEESCIKSNRDRNFVLRSQASNPGKMMNIRSLRTGTLILAATVPVLFAQTPPNLAAVPSSPETTIRVDAKAQTTPFPHFWE